MTPTKLLIGQILIVFGIVFAGIWAATQWAAAMLAYQPELGPPLAIVAGFPIYRPWSLFGWWYHYGAYAEPIFDRAGMIAGASGFVGCAAAIAGSLWRARQSNNVTTYGSARWAGGREIDAAGLHGDAGVLLGSLGGRYLRHDGPEHVMAFAPTRSGKGVSAGDWCSLVDAGGGACAAFHAAINCLASIRLVSSLMAAFHHFSPFRRR